jgi:hypothetical protein
VAPILDVSGVLHPLQPLANIFSPAREMQAFLLEHDAVKTAQEYYDAHFGSGKA